MNEDLDAALEFNNVHEVNEEPDKPGGESGDVDAEDVGDGSGASDDGHVAFVEVMKARGRSLAGQTRGDHFGGEAPTLDGDLRDARQRFALLVRGVGKIADNKNFGMAGDGEVGLHFDATGAIGFGVKASGDVLGKGSGGDTASPEDGARWERMMMVTMLVGDTVGGDASDEDTFHDFDAEAGDKSFGFGGKIFGIGVEDAVAAFDEEDAGFFGSNVAEIVAQSFTGDFGESAGEFEASGARTHDDKREPGTDFGDVGGAFSTLESVEKFVADGGGFFEGFEAGSGVAPIVVAVVGSLRTCGNDEGVVRKLRGVTEKDAFVNWIDVHGFAEKDLGVSLAAEDGAERSGDFAGRQRAGGDLIEERLEEVEIALVDEGDLSVGAFKGVRGDEARETAAENDDLMWVGHGVVVRYIRGKSMQNGCKRIKAVG